MAQRKRHKTLEQVAREEEEISLEETKRFHVEIPLSAYRNLVKLAADSVPFVRFVPYCSRVLIEHSTQPTKGKRAQ